MNSPVIEVVQAIPKVTLTQHVPGFVDMGDGTRKVAVVNGRDAVLALPWVRGWESDIRNGQWCVSGRHLMIDGMRGGKREWWVVGTFSEPVNWFPQWVEPK